MPALALHTICDVEGSKDAWGLSSPVCWIQHTKLVNRSEVNQPQIQHAGPVQHGHHMQHALCVTCANPSLVWGQSRCVLHVAHLPAQPSPLDLTCSRSVGPDTAFRIVPVKALYSACTLEQPHAPCAVHIPNWSCALCEIVHTSSSPQTVCARQAVHITCSTWGQCQHVLHATRVASPRPAGSIAAQMMGLCLPCLWSLTLLIIYSLLPFSSPLYLSTFQAHAISPIFQDIKCVQYEVFMFLVLFSFDF